MEEVAAALRQYGIETVVLALLINLCTALGKIPVKALARKTTNGANITRFIVFMPFVLGFVLTLVYTELVANRLTFDKDFLQLWFTASSLSLTFYAVTEKVFPAKNKQDASVTQVSKELLDVLAETTANEEMPEGKTGEAKKIILRGHNHDGPED